MINSIRIIGDIGSGQHGGTGSLKMFGEDRNHYLVKFKENRQGNIKVVTNELISYLIAAKLQLPIPKSFLAIIDSNIKKLVNDQYNYSVSAGFHFASKWMDDLYPITPILFSNLQNQQSLPLIVLFDILVYNTDRNNSGNVFLHRSEDINKLIILDHGHCFNFNWDVEILNSIKDNIHQSSVSFFNDIIRGSDPFRESINTIKILDNNFLKNITDNIPAEWMISQEEKEALSNFLIYRKENIENILLRNKNLFPNWNEE